MAENKIEHAVQGIVNVLNSEGFKERNVSISTLQEQLVERDIYTNQNRLSVILGTMIACDVLEGSASSNGVVRYKGAPFTPAALPPSSRSDDSGFWQSECATLRETISGLNQSLAKALDENDRQKGITRTIEAAFNQYKTMHKNSNKEVVIKVQLYNKEKVVKEFDGLFHEQFPRILQLAQARKNIFLYGPTGCGKSFVCAQLAQALNLQFAFVSCTAGMSEGVLGGRLLPVGAGGRFDYVISEFIRCFEEGGVFFLDEIDAADPNVLLVINAALANGRIAVTSRPKKPYAVRHKDFICIAAANTIGTGGDRMYSGRNKLDASTLDRFGIGKVKLNYDHRVEEKLCPDEELRLRCWRIRDAIAEHCLERAMSTRFLIDAHEMKHDYGWDYPLIDSAFFAGWREDEFNKVRSHASLN